MLPGSLENQQRAFLKGSQNLNVALTGLNDRDTTHRQPLCGSGEGSTHVHSGDLLWWAASASHLLCDLWKVTCSL